jgi:hypothetical protein
MKIKIDMDTKTEPIILKDTAGHMYLSIRLEVVEQQQQENNKMRFTRSI